MFPELMRKNQQLTHEECLRLLREETRGVLSVLGEGGYPYGTPMNHWYEEEDGCIYFHCGRAGHRLSALRRCGKASYCVYDQGFRRPGEWAWNVSSVIVFGQVEVIDDLERVKDITTRFSRKFVQDEDYIRSEVEKFAPGTLLLKLIPEHICGKLVNEA